MNIGVWLWHTFDKLAKDNKGVKNLLVRQDLFDRTVAANGLEKKSPRKQLVRFRA